MAASTSLGPWGSKVHFTGSSALDVEAGGVIGYPIYGTTSANLTAGSTIPISDGTLIISRATASTAFKVTLPPPNPGCHLDIVMGALQATSGIVDIDAGSAVNIIYGSSAMEFIICTSAQTTGAGAMELLGLTTATWAVNGMSPSTAFLIQGSS